MKKVILIVGITLSIIGLFQSGRRLGCLVSIRKGIRLGISVIVPNWYNINFFGLKKKSTSLVR